MITWAGDRWQQCKQNHVAGGRRCQCQAKILARLEEDVIGVLVWAAPLYMMFCKVLFLVLLGICLAEVEKQFDGDEGKVMCDL